MNASTEKTVMVKNTILVAAIHAISELQEVKELQKEDWEELNSGNSAIDNLNKEIDSLERLKKELKNLMA